MRPDAGPFELGEVGGAGAAVLCLHGLTGTPYEVRPPAEALASNGFACLGPLLPGHGETPEQLARTPRSAWLEAALEAHDRLAKTHARVYALGLSMGGIVALALAARRPVQGLVVLAAPLRLAGLVRLAVPVLSRLVRQLPKRPAIADPEARARHPSYTRMPLPAVREFMQLQREVRAELERVTAPMLLIYSTGDPTVPVSNADLIAATVGSTDCRVHLLSRSAHVLPVDVERDEVAARVLGFFSGLEGRAGR